MREDILKGYQLGADDYITKPFDTELLLYKIKAILQRSATLENEEQEQFKISNIFFDSMLRQLRVGDEEYKLSPKENELLKLLCIHRNDFMPRDLALRKILEKRKLFHGQKYGCLHRQAPQTFESRRRPRNHQRAWRGFPAFG